MLSEKACKVIVDEDPPSAWFGRRDKAALGAAAHFLRMHLEKVGSLSERERVHGRGGQTGIGSPQCQSVYMGGLTWSDESARRIVAIPGCQGRSGWWVRWKSRHRQVGMDDA